MLRDDFIHDQISIRSVYQTQFALIANWDLRRPAYELFSTNDSVGFNSFGEHDRIGSSQDADSFPISLCGNRIQELFCSVDCCITFRIRNRVSQSQRNLICSDPSDLLELPFRRSTKETA